MQVRGLVMLATCDHDSVLSAMDDEERLLVSVVVVTTIIAIGR